MNSIKIVILTNTYNIQNDHFTQSHKKYTHFPEFQHNPVPVSVFWTAAEFFIASTSFGPFLSVKWQQSNRMLAHIFAKGLSFAYRCYFLFYFPAVSHMAVFRGTEISRAVAVSAKKRAYPTIMRRKQIINSIFAPY